MASELLGGKKPKQTKTEQTKNQTTSSSPNREAVISRLGRTPSARNAAAYLVTRDASHRQLSSDSVCNQSRARAAWRARIKPALALSPSETFSGFRHPRALFRQGVTAQVIQLNEISIHNTGTPAVSVQELKGLLHPPQSASLQNQILTTRIVPL